MLARKLHFQGSHFCPVYYGKNKFYQERSAMTQRMAVLAAAPLDPTGFTDMQAIWGDKVELSFSSVITEKTAEAMQPYTADKGGRVLMSGLNDNTVTTISIDKLPPPVEKLLADTRDKADVAFFACAGDFRKLPSSVLTVQPNILLRSIVQSLLQPSMRLGVITPGEPQVPHVFASWLPYLEAVGLTKEQLVVDWTPPNLEMATKCAQRLADQNIDLVAVECLGFKEELRKPIADIVKKPVLLVRTVVASTIKEIASSF